MAAAFRTGADGVVLTVRLTPRSSREAIDGIGRLSDGTPVVLARVRALPEDGAANAALTGLVAKALGVSRSAVTLAAGGKSRMKQVRVAGDPVSLAETIKAWPQRVD